MTKHLMNSLAVICCGFFFMPACKDYNAAELLNCEKAAIDLRVDNQIVPMKILSSTLLRTGSFKVLSLEAFVDTMKVVMNIKDGAYNNEIQLLSDSLKVKTYSYSRKTGQDTTGLVLVGVKIGQDYKFLKTDSAAFTITEIDPDNKNLTGNYYIQTTSPVLKISGAFTKVCFLSIK
ncbi:hypothetical protein GFS24_14710 [Chitinophaga sp. SYP-B3965]|uniref:hypothetical protein n=1 Tax=Chitinophaga sp. SYP-B3965 TaxID=2663120 RepID=UPI00129997A4|nr:hypothetical protein [Chitinophaga sp. SYP-B3965]MRG46371.1 hypothetical protein [Chitinophaga sp. SYP-B3965]